MRDDAGRLQEIHHPQIMRLKCGGKAAGRQLRRMRHGKSSITAVLEIIRHSIRNRGFQDMFADTHASGMNSATAPVNRWFRNPA